jgi:lysine 2,3-aminomutase
MMPSFVVDLPGGGGKRLAAAGSYDPKTGISTFTAPGLPGAKGKRVYEYHDPKPENASADDVSSSVSTNYEGPRFAVANAGG